MSRYGLFLLSCAISIHAWAFDWQSLWQTADQRAYAWMRSNRFDAAEVLFSNQAWAAAAAYRAKHFARAAKLYRAVSTNDPTADAHYNEGNALAQAKQLNEAIAAYDRALALDPKHNDALHNKRIVQTLLKQQQAGRSTKPQVNQQSKTPEQKNTDQPQSNAHDQKPATSDSKATSSSKAPKNKPQNNHHDAPPEKSSLVQSTKPSQTPKQPTQKEQEKQQENEQWLRLIPDDPGGLMREKFRRDYIRQQNGWY